MTNLKKYLEYFIALNLIILGIDKFIGFIPESCSLMGVGSSLMWKLTGVIEILLGVLLFLGRYTNFILGFIIGLMLWAILMHIVNGTYDIGGAIFLAILCIIPFFLGEKNNQTKTV